LSLGQASWWNATRVQAVGGAGACLCAAGLVFPYSVAATNVALGVAIGLGLLSGLLFRGLAFISAHHRLFAIVFALYLSLFPVGLLWSPDIGHGLDVFAHQWFWLILPVVCALTHDAVWRERFVYWFCLGLGSNLFYCVAQALGWVVLTTPNSGPEDATGHLGHGSFGLVYGIWAAWLLYRGWRRGGWQRWLMWFFAAWSWVMIFAAQGRGGYIVALSLAMLLACRFVLEGLGFRRALLMIAGLLSLTASILALGPGREEVRTTVEHVQAMQEERLGSIDYRWSFWNGIALGWLDNPILGVGTGGYPDFAARMKRLHPEFNYAEDMRVEHPHNAYLLALARWGAVGLIIVLALLFLPFKKGWRSDWSSCGNAIFLSLASLALAVQGLVASSLEEHASGVFASLLLGLGLSLAHKHQGNHRHIPSA